MRIIAHSLTFLLVIFLLKPSIALSDDAPIKLGYLLDLSSKGAFMGQQSRAGSELAVKELRSEGIQVEIVFEDHRTDGKIGATGAQKLISVDDVDAVMCDLTPPCIAASPIVQNAERLFVYQAPIVSILQSNPYSFKNFLDYESGCREIGRFWKSLGISRVAHFQVNAEFGELCAKGAADFYPDQKLMEYDAGSDLRSLVLRGKGANPEAVFQTGYEGDYVNRLKAEKDLQLQLPTGMPEPLLTDVVLAAAGPTDLDQSITFGFKDISPEFVSRLREAKLYTTDVAIQSAAIAYLHVKQLVSALRKCPSRALACQTDAFAKADSNDILGFKGWRSRIANYDYQLKMVRGGKLVPADVEQIKRPEMSAVR